MIKYVATDYTFDALCLNRKVSTLAYLVGLVDSDKHVAGNPEFARYQILYPLSEGEAQVDRPRDLVEMTKAILPPTYLPQTPVMFVKQWSPIFAMIQNGFVPEILSWLGEAPHAVASGIWRPKDFTGAKRIVDCISDEELFWAIMMETFNRARQRDCFVSVIAQVGWSYEHMIGSLPVWNDKQVAQTGRILWKRTWQG